MNPSCTHLAEDHADAATLCNWMITSGIRSVSQIDTGVQTIDFASSPPHVETLANTQSNGVLEASEVYSAAIDVLEKEEDCAFASSFFTDAAFLYANYVAQNTSLRVPWLLNRSLMSQIAPHISSIKSELLQKGLVPQTLDYNLALARALADYIVNPQGLAVSRTHIASQEWTAAEVLTQSKEADCTEFSAVYYELCRLAGLDANIVEVIINSSGFREYHICVGLRLNPSDSNDITFVDLTRTNPIHSVPPREWVFIPDLTAVAYYRMNLGLKPPKSVFALGEDAKFNFAEKQYQIASSLDPDLPLLNYNTGKLYKYYGHPELALPYFQRAVEFEPDNVLFAHALSSLVIMQGQ